MQRLSRDMLTLGQSYQRTHRKSGNQPRNWRGRRMKAAELIRCPGCPAPGTAKGISRQMFCHVERERHHRHQQKYPSKNHQPLAADKKRSPPIQSCSPQPRQKTSSRSVPNFCCEAGFSGSFFRTWYHNSPLDRRQLFFDQNLSPPTLTASTHKCPRAFTRPLHIAECTNMTILVTLFSYERFSHAIIQQALTYLLKPVHAVMTPDGYIIHRINQGGIAYGSCWKTRSHV